MLKIDSSKKDKKMHIEVGGSMDDIVNEILNSIHIIHASICKEKGVIAGIAFQTIIESMISECMKPQKGDDES